MDRGYSHRFHVTAKLSPSEWMVLVLNIVDPGSKLPCRTSLT